MIHISPWESCISLFDEASTILSREGVVIFMALLRLAESTYLRVMLLLTKALNRKTPAEASAISTKCQPSPDNTDFTQCEIGDARQQSIRNFQANTPEGLLAPPEQSHKPINGSPVRFSRTPGSWLFLPRVPTPLLAYYALEVPGLHKAIVPPWQALGAD